MGLRRGIRRQRWSKGDRYRHGDGSTRTTTFTARGAERKTINLLLAYTDGLPMMARREVPAEDHQAELRRVQESLDELDRATDLTNRR